MKRSTLIVLVIVLLLSVSYGVITMLSADDGLPDEAAQGVEDVVPSPVD